jgi:hypothetical protein
MDGCQNRYKFGTLPAEVEDRLDEEHWEIFF